MISVIENQVSEANSARIEWNQGIDYRCVLTSNGSRGIKTIDRTRTIRSHYYRHQLFFFISVLPIKRQFIDSDSIYTPQLTEKSNRLFTISPKWEFDIGRWRNLKKDMMQGNRGCWELCFHTIKAIKSTCNWCCWWLLFPLFSGLTHRPLSMPGITTQPIVMDFLSSPFLSGCYIDKGI